VSKRLRPPSSGAPARGDPDRSQLGRDAPDGTNPEPAASRRDVPAPDAPGRSPVASRVTLDPAAAFGLSLDPNAPVPDTYVLAPYAAHDATSRGRRYAEPRPPFRTEYQRDRDRIIHSNAFRRLIYKTQVFVNHEGDLYRTRITHSLEVAQIARSAAVALRLNEYLTEAIALAHDLGHTPFGHAGQDALNECMRPYGGFEHNLQSLRVVDELEERYAEFPGLNLTFECREGILKHCSVRNASDLGELGERFLQRRQPGLEAQIANLADEIAYNNHDVDDGIRAGMIEIRELMDVRLFRRQYDIVVAKYPDLGERRLVHETIRRMINYILTDLITTTQSNIDGAQPQSIDDVRLQPKPLAALSETGREEHTELMMFLRDRLYRHYKVVRMTTKARRVLLELFEAFFNDTNLLPTEYRTLATVAEKSRGLNGRARAVADYIAGMTDRFAIIEHRRLLDPAERT
jgi:dGTPase